MAIDKCVIAIQGRSASGKESLDVGDYQESIAQVREQGVLVVMPDNVSSVVSKTVQEHKDEIEELFQALHKLKISTEMFNSFETETFFPKLSKKHCEMYNSLTDLIREGMLQTARTCGYFHEVVEVPSIGNVIFRLKSRRNHSTPLHCDLRHYINTGVLLDPVDSIYDTKSVLSVAPTKNRLQETFHDTEDSCLYVPYWTAIVLLQDLREGASEVMIVPESHQYPLIWNSKELKARSATFKKALLRIRRPDSEMRELEDGTSIVLKAGTTIFIQGNTLHYGSPHLGSIGAKIATQRAGDLKYARLTSDFRFAARLNDVKNHPCPGNDFYLNLALESAEALEVLFTIIFGEDFISFDMEAETVTSAAVNGCMIVFLIDVVHSMKKSRKGTDTKIINQLQLALERCGDILMKATAKTRLNWKDVSISDREQPPEDVMIDHLHIMNLRYHAEPISQEEMYARGADLVAMSEERLCSCDFNQSSRGIDNFRDLKTEIRRPKPDDKYHTQLEAFYRYWIFSQLAYDIDCNIMTSSKSGLGALELETNLIAICSYRKHGYRRLIALFSDVVAEHCKIVELVTHMIYAFSGWGKCSLPDTFFEEEICLMRNLTLTSCRFNVDALCEKYFAFVILGRLEEADIIKRRVFILKTAYEDAYIPSLDDVQNGRYKKLNSQQDIFGIYWHSHWALTLLSTEIPPVSAFSNEIPELSKYARMLILWRKICKNGPEANISESTTSTSRKKKNNVVKKRVTRTQSINSSSSGSDHGHCSALIPKAAKKSRTNLKISNSTSSLGMAEENTRFNNKEDLLNSKSENSPLSSQMKLFQTTLEQVQETQAANSRKLDNLHELCKEQFASFETLISEFRNNVPGHTPLNSSNTRRSNVQSGVSRAPIVTANCSGANCAFEYNSSGELIVNNDLSRIIESWVLRNVLRYEPFASDDFIVGCFIHYVDEALAVGNLNPHVQLRDKDRLLLESIQSLFEKEAELDILEAEQSKEETPVENGDILFLRVIKAKIAKQRTQTRSSFVSRAKVILEKDSRLKYKELSSAMKLGVLINIESSGTLQDAILLAAMMKAACKSVNADLFDDIGLKSLLFVGLTVQARHHEPGKIAKRIRTDISNKISWEAISKRNHGQHMTGRKSAITSSSNPTESDVPTPTLTMKEEERLKEVLQMKEVLQVEDAVTPKRITQEDAVTPKRIAPMSFLRKMMENTRQAKENIEPDNDGVITFRPRKKNKKASFLDRLDCSSNNEDSNDSDSENSAREIEAFGM